ncbi:MAG: hypothetical protein LUD77_06195 [Clostridiales bacterium]|nr:hypothetical protein [Clostridiales bacterium]
MIMNALQKYFSYRQSLINQYIKGDMKKEEYLESNFEAVLALRDKPFKYVDNIEKGLFNYQYYNSMAKACKMEQSSCSDREKNILYYDKINYYYDSKDKATMKILKLIDFQNIGAYFIKVRSKYLRGRLFEIILEDYEGIILHSQNEGILNKLREMGVFKEDSKKSVIDYYINSKY